MADSTSAASRYVVTCSFPLATTIEVAVSARTLSFSPALTVLQCSRASTHWMQLTAEEYFQPAHQTSHRRRRPSKAHAIALISDSIDKENADRRSTQTTSTTTHQRRHFAIGQNKEQPTPSATTSTPKPSLTRTIPAPMSDGGPHSALHIRTHFSILAAITHGGGEDDGVR